MDLNKISDEELNQKLAEFCNSQQYQYLCEKARREIRRMHTELESVQDIGDLKKLQGKISMFNWVLRNFNGITTL